MDEVSRTTRSLSQLRLQFYKHERKGVRFVINWEGKPNLKKKAGDGRVSCGVSQKHTLSHKGEWL